MALGTHTSNDRGQISRVWLGLLCLGLVLLVGALDHFTGSEVGFSIFYLIPVVTGTRLLGLRAGLVLSVLSAVAWWLDDAVLGSRVYSHPIIPVWNAAMRCGVFVLMSSLVAGLMKARAVERRSLNDLSVAYADLERTRKEQLQLKDQLLSHVSHELRTPLTAIHQFITIPLDGMAGGALNPEQRECLETALRNVEQLGRLIGDLLDSARLDSGKLVVEPQVISLSDVVQETVLSLSMVAKKKRIRVSRRCPADVPPVFADPYRVRQVLYNLVDNAIKFTPERGDVTIEIAPDSDEQGFARVTVSDTGKGISEQALATVFERLYQAERDGDSGRQGLGLGLFICREVVTRLGGKISVESVVGRGSCFRFTLPLAEATNASVASPRVQEISR